MDAYQTLLNNIKRFVQLTTEEEDEYVSIMRLTKVRKKQLIVQPTFVCKYKSYIFQGAMRSYLIDDNGGEHTVSVGIEDWWISDFASFIFQEPATLFVEALEDSVLVQIDHNEEEKLLQRVPKFERYLRIFSQRALAYSQKRTLTNISKSAEKRYDEFLLRYPQIVYIQLWSLK